MDKVLYVAHGKLKLYYPPDTTKCTVSLHAPGKFQACMINLLLLKTSTVFRPGRMELQSHRLYTLPLLWSKVQLHLHHTTASGSLQRLRFLLHPAFSCRLLSRMMTLSNLLKV